MMKPLIRRIWEYDDAYRFGTVWIICGIRVPGRTYLPWEVASGYPWAWPPLCDKLTDELIKSESDGKS